VIRRLEIRETCLQASKLEESMHGAVKDVAGRDQGTGEVSIQLTAQIVGKERVYIDVLTKRQQAILSCLELPRRCNRR